MVKQITRGKDIARNTYWSAVGMTAATMLAVQPVFADTIWDRFSTILKRSLCRDLYPRLGAGDAGFSGRKLLSHGRWCCSFRSNQYPHRRKEHKLYHCRPSGMGWRLLLPVCG